MAYLGLKGHKGVFLSTAHPAKFSQLLEKVLGKKIPLPKSLKTNLGNSKDVVQLPNDFNRLKSFFLGY